MSGIIVGLIFSLPGLLIVMCIIAICIRSTFSDSYYPRRNFTNPYPIVHVSYINTLSNNFIQASTMFNLRLIASEQCVFINRKEEVDFCMNKIEYGESIIISGESGVGKTQFLYHLKHKTLELFTERHVVYLNLEHDNGQDNNHLLAIIEALLRYSWVEILLQDIMDLYKLGNKTRFPNDKLYRACVDIQSMLSFSFCVENEGEVGLPILGITVTGKTNKAYQSNYSITRDKLLVFISHLNTEIANYVGKETLVILCDEAKYAPIDEKKEIMYDLLNTTKCLGSSFVYIYSDANQDINEDKRLPIHTLKLQNFKKYQYTRDFIASRKENNLHFTEDAIQCIHSLTEGHPRNIIRLLDIVLSEKGQVEDDTPVMITHEFIKSIIKLHSL